jgi:hypothetical protein
MNVLIPDTSAGVQIGKHLLDAGHKVIIMCRYPEQVKRKYKYGYTFVFGDLSLPYTLPNAFTRFRIDVVIAGCVSNDSTESSNFIETEWKGTLALLEIAKIAQVSRFIYLSLVGQKVNPSTPLESVKAKFEETLINSGLPYTIYHLPGFSEPLTQEYAYPILTEEAVWVSDKEWGVPYVDSVEVGIMISDSITNTKIAHTTKNEIITMIGKSSWLPSQIIRLCERYSGKEANIKYLPRTVIYFLSQVLRGLRFTQDISERLLPIENVESISKTDGVRLKVSTIFELLRLINEITQDFHLITSRPTHNIKIREITPSPDKTREHITNLIYSYLSHGYSTSFVSQRENFLIVENCFIGNSCLQTVIATYFANINELIRTCLP